MTLVECDVISLWAVWLRNTAVLILSFLQRLLEASGMLCSDLVWHLSHFSISNVWIDEGGATGFHKGCCCIVSLEQSFYLHLAQKVWSCEVPEIWQTCVNHLHNIDIRNVNWQENENIISSNAVIVDSNAEADGFCYMIMPDPMLKWGFFSSLLCLHMS